MKYSSNNIGLLIAVLLACSQQATAFTTQILSYSGKSSNVFTPALRKVTSTFYTPPAKSSALFKPPTTTTTTSTTTSTTSLHAIPAALGALPLSQKIFWSCLLPTCLGFYKSEYGVSYAYGIATALTSFWIYRAFAASTATTTTAAWHAGAVMFYGVRLCLFLAYREAFIQRIKDSVQRIEDKAKERGSRLKRAPFVVSCAGLYFGLCAPLLITSQVDLTSIPKGATTLLQALIGTTWAGFILGALGDFNKSIVKSIKGENHLVTGGIYRFFRHPNYTGEIIGWTSNGLAAVVAAIAAKGVGLKPWPLVGLLSASVLGAAGLDFVLVQATGGLEKRQKEAYGDTEEYKEWIEKSWVGFPPPVKDIIDEAVETKPEIKPKVNEKEGGGTGI